MLVFGQTEYCIAWPTPSRYGTQLKYGASNGLLWVLTHNPCMIMSSYMRLVKINEVENLRVFHALDFCRCALDLTS